MHISLTPTLKDYTREKVDSGLYNNASEVIREALRLMVDRDQKKELLKEAVAHGFQEIDDGDFTDVSSRSEFLALARQP